MERTRQQVLREIADVEGEINALEERRLGLLTESERLGDLDRAGMIDAARKLAADLVETHGTDGAAGARFLADSDARFASQLGANELQRIWLEAIGREQKRPVKS